MEQVRMCNCNQGRLPCQCRDEPARHTMKTVMVALQAARVEGKGLPMLTSNQCHALAQELNRQL